MSLANSGLNITKTKDGYNLNQSGYIKETLEKFGMTNCNATYVPLPPSWDLTKNVGGSVDTKLFQSLVGKLLYASNGNIPDIAYAVSKLSRHLKDPREKAYDCCQTCHEVFERYS